MGHTNARLGALFCFSLMARCVLYSLAFVITILLLYSVKRCSFLIFVPALDGRRVI